MVKQIKSAVMSEWMKILLTGLTGLMMTVVSASLFGAYSKFGALEKNLAVLTETVTFIRSSVADIAEERLPRREAEQEFARLRRDIQDLKMGVNTCRNSVNELSKEYYRNKP